MIMWPQVMLMQKQVNIDDDVDKGTKYMAIKWTQIISDDVDTGNTQVMPWQSELASMWIQVTGNNMYTSKQ